MKANNMKIVAAVVFTALAWRCQALTHVDLLVAYDTSAAQWIDAESRTCEQFAEEQIARSNQVLANSGLGNDFDFRLVGVYKGAFTHSSMSTSLNSAIESTDAAWADLRSARDAAGADIVVVLVKGGDTAQKGTGTTLVPMVNGERKYGLEFAQADEFLKWFAERAFCIVDIVAASEGYVLVHEVGHVMGAGHSEIISPSYDEPGPQLYNYSSAVMMQGSDGNYYATVMGYNVTGYPGSANYKELPYFSSPDVVNPETGEALGDATHNNVLTLRNTYSKVAAFKNEVASTGGEDGGTSVAPVSPVVPSTPVAAGEFTARNTYFTAAVMDGDGIVGIAEFGVAATKKGMSKVSATFIGLDGKKMKAKNAQYAVYKNEGGTACVRLDGVSVNGANGLLSVTLGNDGSLTSGTLGSYSLVSATKGMEKASAGFYIAEPLETIMGGEVIQSVTYDGVEYDMLPDAQTPENVTTGTKWTVAKGGRLKMKKDRQTGESILIPAGTQNFSDLRLNYQAKTGTFKGSFKAYAIIGGRLKNFKFNVTGVAVNGKGVGISVCKNAGVSLKVVIE